MSTPNANLEVDVSRTRYQTSKDGLLAAGLKFSSENSKSASFVWIDGLLTRDEALDFGSEQRVNKIPGMDFICYKSTLFQALNNMRKFFPDVYSTVYPRAFLLPGDFAEFQREHTQIIGKTQQAPTWVIKPKNGCCGHGISLVQSTYEASDITEPSVCQLYIAPYLINQRKFDFRLYVLVASLEPLTIFIYKEGIARFCTDAYEPPSRTNRDHKFSHLTNTAINVENGNVDPSEFTKKFTDIMQIILNKTPNKGKQLWEKICEATRAVVVSVLPLMLGSLPRRNDFKNQKYKTIHDSNDDDSKNEKMLQIQQQQSPHYPPPRSDIVRKQMNFVLDVPPSSGNDSSTTNNNNSNNNNNEMIVGSVINYKLPTNLQQHHQIRANRRGSISPDHRMKRKVIIPKPAHHQRSILDSSQFSVGSNHHHHSLNRSQNTQEVHSSSPEPPPEIDYNHFQRFPINPRNQNETHIEENKSTEQNNEAEEDTTKKATKTKVSKRYFHILGIDIIISDEVEPFVLELNDRPSLSVTVPFENDLKVKLIRDSFFHVLPGGEIGPETEESDWQLIFPLDQEKNPRAAVWKDVMTKASIPAPPSNSVASTFATNRMASSGINPALHQARRQRFMEINENSKGVKFNPY